MAPRRRSEIMVDVRDRIARRLERKLSREAAWKQRLGFPIVANPATRLTADRKDRAPANHGAPRESALSAGINSGEGGQ